MALVELIVVAGYASALAGTAGLLAWREPSARRGRQNRRRLAKTPVTPIGELAPGNNARVRGHVVAADEQFTAPLTGRKSVYFEARAVVHTSDDDFVERPVDRAQTDFWVVDGTGAVLVRSTGLCTVVVREDYDRRTQARPEVNPEMHAAVQRFQEGLKAGLQGQRRDRLIAGQVYSLDVGEEVTVWGAVGEDAVVGVPGQAGYRGAPTRVAVLADAVVSDDPEFLE